MNRDVDIILRFQQGDRSAFEQIYRDYYAYALMVAMHYTHNKSDAEDVVQEAFAQVYRSLDSLQDPNAFRSWLATTVHRFFIRSVRNKSVKMKVDLGEEVDVSQLLSTDQMDQPDHHYHRNEVMHAIETGFNHLNARQQEIARMRFYEEKSVEEIAEILKIPEGTIKSRLFTIRKKLQAYLKQCEIVPSHLTPAMVGPLMVRFYALWEQQLNRVAEPKPFEAVLLVGSTGNAARHLRKKPKVQWTTILSVGAITSISVGAGALVVNPPSQQVEPEIRSLQAQADVNHTEARITLTLSENKNVRQVMVYGPSVASDMTVDTTGVYQMSVSENGDYKIEVIRNDYQIIQQTLTIDSIDVTGPILVSQDYQDGRLTIRLSDELTSVEPASVVLDCQGSIVTPDQVNDAYVFNIEEPASCLLETRDVAGNESQFQVDFITQRES